MADSNVAGAVVSIQTKFKTDIITAEGIADDRYILDNLQEESIEDGTWIRLQILEGEASRIELGPNGTERIPGIMVASIFVELNTGTAEGLALADKVRTAFRGSSAGVVEFDTPSIDRVGPVGQFYQINVVCPFWFDGVC